MPFYDVLWHINRRREEKSARGGGHAATDSLAGQVGRRRECRVGAFAVTKPFRSTIGKIARRI